MFYELLKFLFNFHVSTFVDSTINTVDSFIGQNNSFFVQVSKIKFVCFGSKKTIQWNEIVFYDCYLNDPIRSSTGYGTTWRWKNGANVRPWYKFSNKMKHHLFLYNDFGFIFRVRDAISRGRCVRSVFHG